MPERATVYESTRERERVIRQESTISNERATETERAKP